MAEAPKDIYKLKMYEKTIVPTLNGYYLYDVVRVPGGWIFSRNDLYAVFVPNTKDKS